MKHAQNFVFVILALVIIILIYLLFFMLPKPEIKMQNPRVEVLDVQVLENPGSLQTLAYTLKVLDGDIDLSECKVRLDSGEDSAELSYGSRRESLNTIRTQVLEPSNDDVIPVDLKVPLSSEKKDVGDIDSDGIDDLIFVCTKKNCPPSFDGRYIAVNLSLYRALSYIPLKNSSDLVDISKPYQRLAIRYSKALKRDIAMTIEGTTSDVPYTIGLDNEKITIYKRLDLLDADLDEDGLQDYYLNLDNIVIFLSSREFPIITAEGNIGSEEDMLGIINKKDNETELIPFRKDKGRFVTDPLMDDSHAIAREGSAIRILAIPPEDISRGEEVTFTLECTGADPVGYQYTVT